MYGIGTSNDALVGYGWASYETARIAADRIGGFVVAWNGTGWAPVHGCAQC